MLKDPIPKHFNKRLMERFGLIISDEEYENLISQIVSYDSIPVEVCAETGKSLHIVKIQERKVVVVAAWVNEDSVKLITVLRKNWIEKDGFASYKYKKKSGKVKGGKVNSRTRQFLSQYQRQKYSIQMEDVSCMMPESKDL